MMPMLHQHKLHKDRKKTVPCLTCLTLGIAEAAGVSALAVSTMTIGSGGLDAEALADEFFFALLYSVTMTPYKPMFANSWRNFLGFSGTSRRNFFFCYGPILPYYPVRFHFKFRASLSQ